MSNKLTLPKPYLSYSAISLWLRDKDAYRSRYYENEPFVSTPYTEFGNKVGKALELGELFDDTLKKVPRNPVMEQKLTVDIEGVPFLGYLDSYDPDTKEVLEYKTGIISKEGKEPWSRLAVRKHTQLTMYQLAVLTKYGEYNPDIKLVWMETRWTKVPETVTIGSKEFTSDVPGLELTGRVEIFDRHIEPWELDRMARIIKEVAGDISNDYKLWMKTNQKSQTK